MYLVYRVILNYCRDFWKYLEITVYFLNNYVDKFYLTTRRYIQQDRIMRTSKLTRELRTYNGMRLWIFICFYLIVCLAIYFGIRRVGPSCSCPSLRPSIHPSYT
jgi:hypothetical protein